MSKKKKAAQEPVQVAKPEPFKYTFRPVQLETPVEIIQSFRYTSTANQEFGNSMPECNVPVAPVEEPKKAKKAKKEKAPRAKRGKCGVRKVQNFFFVLTLLVIAALVASYFFVGGIKETVEFIVASNNEPLHKWLSGNYVCAIVPLVVAAFLLSIVLRWLVHPLVCKTKKCKHCCGGCEFLAYTWTVLVVGIVLSVVFVLTRTLGFDKIYESSLNVVNNVLVGNPINTKQAYTVYCLIASGVVLVLLVLISIIHAARDKRRALLEEEAYYAQNSGSKVEDVYGLNNDLDNPNHPFAENKGKKSHKGLKVFLVLVVLAVAAVAVLYLLGMF